MVHKDETITNGVNGANGTTKAKTLSKSFDSIQDTVESFGKTGAVRGVTA
jgi:hypothetical protein